MHPVIDTQSEDCHSGTELLCQRNKVGSKRRFCSAVLCFTANGAYGYRRLVSSTPFHSAHVAMSATGASPALEAAVAAPVPGTVLNLQRRKLRLSPIRGCSFVSFTFSFSYVSFYKAVWPVPWR